jgi:hypothetical protein
MITEKETLRLQVLIDRASQARVDLHAAKRHYDMSNAELNDYVESLKKSQDSDCTCSSDGRAAAS